MSEYNNKVQYLNFNNELYKHGIKSLIFHWQSTVEILFNNTVNLKWTLSFCICMKNLFIYVLHKNMKGNQI